MILLSILLSFLIGVLSIVWLLGCKFRFKSTLPGPKPLPVLGNLHHFYANRSRMLEWLQENQQQYGDTFCMHNRDRFVVAITRPEDVRHFLMDKFDHFERFGTRRRRFYEVFGNGIFSSNGENWKHQRATARPMFTKASLVEMLFPFIRNGRKVIQVLEKFQEESLEMQDLFQRYTLDSIGEIGFGHDVGALDALLRGDKTKVRFAQAFDYTQRIVEESGRNPYLEMFAPRQYNVDLAYLNQFVLDIIEKRFKDQDFYDKSDLLARFMQLKDADGEQLPKSYLRDVVLNFFIAGRDTTASLLTWTFYLLSSHPHVEEKLRVEINSTLRTAEDFTYENIKSMKYMKQVLNEVLRLYPPVPVDARQCIKATTFPSGFTVQPGTLILYSAYLTHRMKEFWGEDALQFRPERFDTPLKHQFQFVPFHGGPQICLGQNMALTEAAILVSMILQKFQLRLKKGVEVKPRKSIILVADQGIPMDIISVK